MNRRRLFRYIAYTLLGVLFLLMLVLYAVYLSAQRPPRYYREALAVPYEIQELRNREMLQKIRILNNDVQNTEKPWQGSFSAEELNAYLAVEAVKPEANLLPHDVVEPRLSISPRTIELTARLEQGALTGVLHFTFGLSVPSPNRLAVRVKDARLGRLPVSREHARDVLREALEKQGYAVETGNEGGDPTLTFDLDLKYGKHKSIRLESLETVGDQIMFSGSTVKQDHHPPAMDR